MKIPAGEKPSNLSSMPSNVKVAGTYHVSIVDVKQSETKNGSIVDRIVLEVLAGTDPFQVNARASASLFRNPCSGDEQWSNAHIRWAWATGLLSEGEDIHFDPSMLIGRECIASIEPADKYANVTSRGDDVWRLDSPEVSSVPKAQRMAAVRRESYDDLI